MKGIVKGGMWFLPLVMVYTFVNCATSRNDLLYILKVCGALNDASPRVACGSHERMRVISLNACNQHA